MSRISTLIGVMTALGGVILAAPASDAASGANLRTSWSAPSSPIVGDTARYSVVVHNAGNRRSNAVTVTVSLPRTSTSPTVLVRGSVSNLSPGCSLSGTTITCNVAAIGRGASATIGFDLRLPYATTPHMLRAVAATSNETASGDNTADRTVSLTYYAPSVAAPRNVTNRHCTGTALTSFVECEYFPSSISMHQVTFVDNGSGPNAGALDFVTLNGSSHAAYGGSWTVSGTQLSFVYTEAGQPVASFVGRGSSAGCWDGLVTFIPSSSYVAMYRVCLS